MVEFALDSKF